MYYVYHVIAYLSAASFISERVDVQVGYAQQTVVAPTHVAAQRRHRVQRTGRSDRVGAHQRRVRSVLVAAAAVERGPFHFGDEQGLHERAGPVQTVERPELGLMTAERLTASVNAVRHHRSVSIVVSSVTASVIVASAAHGRRAAATVVAAADRHRHAAVAAAPVQVAERRRCAPAQVAGHASILFRFARR